MGLREGHNRRIKKRSTKLGRRGELCQGLKGRRGLKAMGRAGSKTVKGRALERDVLRASREGRGGRGGHGVSGDLKTVKPCRNVNEEVPALRGKMGEGPGTPFGRQRN